LELVIQVDTAGADASIKSVNKSLSGLETEAVSSAKGASKGIDGMTLSMTKAVVAGNAIYDAAKRAFSGLKDFRKPMKVAQDRPLDTDAGTIGVLENQRNLTPFEFQLPKLELTNSRRKCPFSTHLAVITSYNWIWLTTTADWVRFHLIL
jgi:hypothetical protein